MLLRRVTVSAAGQPLRAGFTLAELLAVVAILAILAGVAIPSFMVIVSNQRIKVTKSECKKFAGMLKTLAMNHQDDFPQNQGYPATSGGLDVLVQFSMLSQIPEDAWHNGFQWYLEANPVSGALEPIVISAGPDLQFGTADDISSIQN
jgi:prepilin-type N-terminal cleavage/methylation domain-containing protein